MTKNMVKSIKYMTRLMPNLWGSKEVRQNPFSDTIKKRHASTSRARIFMAGDYRQAQEALRSLCSTGGACYCIGRCEYVYSGGQESGIEVTVIDYPRFPFSSADHLQRHAEDVAEYLMEALHQSSSSIIGPKRTTMLSRRKKA